MGDIYSMCCCGPPAVPQGYDLLYWSTGDGGPFVFLGNPIPLSSGHGALTGSGYPTLREGTVRGVERLATVDPSGDGKLAHGRVNSVASGHTRARLQAFKPNGWPLRVDGSDTVAGVMEDMLSRARWLDKFFGSTQVVEEQYRVVHFIGAVPASETETWALVGSSQPAQEPNPFTPLPEVRLLRLGVDGELLSNTLLPMILLPPPEVTNGERDAPYPGVPPVAWSNDKLVWPAGGASVSPGSTNIVVEASTSGCVERFNTAAFTGRLDGVEGVAGYIQDSEELGTSQGPSVIETYVQRQKGDLQSPGVWYGVTHTTPQVVAFSQRHPDALTKRNLMPVENGIVGNGTTRVVVATFPPFEKGYLGDRFWTFAQEFRFGSHTGPGFEAASGGDLVFAVESRTGGLYDSINDSGGTTYTVNGQPAADFVEVRGPVPTGNASSEPSFDGGTSGSSPALFNAYGVRSTEAFRCLRYWAVTCDSASYSNYSYQQEGPGSEGRSITTGWGAALTFSRYHRLWLNGVTRDVFVNSAGDFSYFAFDEPVRELVAKTIDGQSVWTYGSSAATDIDASYVDSIDLYPAERGNHPAGAAAAVGIARWVGSWPGTSDDVSGGDVLLFDEQLNILAVMRVFVGDILAPIEYEVMAVTDQAVYLNLLASGQWRVTLDGSRAVSLPENWDTHSTTQQDPLSGQPTFQHKPIRKSSEAAGSTIDLTASDMTPSTFGPAVRPA